MYNWVYFCTINFVIKDQKVCCYNNLAAICNLHGHNTVKTILTTVTKIQTNNLATRVYNLYLHTHNSVK